MPRQGFLAPILAVVVAAGLPHAAHAGWSPDPVTVRATNSLILVAAACSDGATGTFVSWHDPDGQLRLQHLLWTGDLDYRWPPDGAHASGVISSPRFIDVIPDHLGGVYVCWLQGSALLVTRLDDAGRVAAGWPLSGKSIGAVWYEIVRFRAIEDGSHGLYVCWTGDSPSGSGTELFAQRLGPDGLGAGGWPNGPEVVAPSGPVPIYHLWPDLALGPDGGVFVSWATVSVDSTVVQSGMYLRRLTGAGANSPGWPAEGMYLGSVHWLLAEDNVIETPLLDISPDDRGGLFCFMGTLWESGGHAAADCSLRRLLADGQPSPGWPVDGRVISSEDYYGAGGADNGLRVRPDGQDGALLERWEYMTHSPPTTSVSRYTDEGQSSIEVGYIFAAGHQVVAKAEGGAYVAEFSCCLPFGPYAPCAFIALHQSNPGSWTHWSEGYCEPRSGYAVYGDIALAPSGDGGVVFFWSQVRDRFGLFARKFNPWGEATAVDPGTGPGSLALSRLRFVDGIGVVARVALSGASARLELFDVVGRRVSLRTHDVDGPSATDVTLPGTASLAPGLYFLRLASEQAVAHGKVAVVR